MVPDEMRLYFELLNFIVNNHKVVLEEEMWKNNTKVLYIFRQVVKSFLNV